MVGSILQFNDHVRDLGVCHARYLMDHCTLVSDVAYRQRLCSASGHEVSVPRHRLSTYGRRAFAIAGPTVKCLELFARGHAASGGF